MNEQYKWQKMKAADLGSVEKLLRANEAMYVSACGRFLSRGVLNDPIWLLQKKKEEAESLILSSRSTLMPVFCANDNITNPDFLCGFFNKKKIHSIQGLAAEVEALQETIKKTKRAVKDIFEYDLMSLDKKPDPNNAKNEPDNIVLKVPQLTDLEQIAQLHAAYEKEEVLPKGSVFSPAGSRINTANIIVSGRILTAQIDGRFVGKINVNAVSFTRYQVGGVYVHPNFRGRGIARKMAFEFISSLIEQGRGVTLFVKKNNTAACKLYKGLGFTVKGDYRITYY